MQTQLTNHCPHCEKVAHHLQAAIVSATSWREEYERARTTLWSIEFNVELAYTQARMARVYVVDLDCSKHLDFLIEQLEEIKAKTACKIPVGKGDRRVLIECPPNEIVSWLGWADTNPQESPVTADLEARVPELKSTNPWQAIALLWAEINRLRALLAAKERGETD